MAFKPLPNQSYYLVAKHSGKVLGFTDSSRGKQLQQMNYDKGNKQQHFRFDGSTGFFWILTPPFKNNYLAVHDSSSADGVPILQWEWEAPKHNSRFYIEPAGGGYYRIKAMHSGKYLDVFEAKQDHGAAVVQHRLMSSENQVFMPVPVVGTPIAASPQSFKQTTDLIREATLGLVGLLPTIGGGLKVLLGGLWAPEDQLSQLWERMKEYVDLRINAAIEQQVQTDLRARLTGELKAFKELLKTTDALKRSNNFNGLMQNLVSGQDFFIDKPKERLPYLLGYATLFLAMRKAAAYHYKEFHGIEPTADILKENKELLKADIVMWSEQVASKKQELLDARMALVKNRHDYHKTRSAEDGGSTTAFFSTAEDAYDGWSMTWSLNDYRDSDDDYQECAENAAAQRKKQVRVQYESLLDEFIRISRFWQYLDPDQPPYKAVTVKKEVGYFGGPNHHNGFAGVANSYISKIIVHSNNNRKGRYLCGIEVFYGEKVVSDGLRGAKGSYTEELTLGKDEYITSAFGYMKRFVEGVWFTTQKGRTAGGGSDQYTYFCADLADSFNPRLVNISGATSSLNANIERLSFHWEYQD